MRNKSLMDRPLDTDESVSSGSGTPPNIATTTSSSTSFDPGPSTLPSTGRTYLGLHAYDNTTAILGDVIGSYFIQPPSLQTFRQLAALQQEQNDEARQKRLIDSLIFPYMNARILNVDTALPQTCEWVFTDGRFTTWLDDGLFSEHHGFLWIKGQPGTGKSTLMKAVHDLTKRTLAPNDAVISYFFNGQAMGELEKSSQGLYQSLAYQILRKLPQALDPFLKRFQLKLKDNSDNVEAWTTSELKGFLWDTLTPASQLGVAIFIDALDEGNEDDVRDLVLFLERLAAAVNSQSTHLRLCLSSRHYPHIHVRKGLHIVLEDQIQHHHDIELYLKETLRPELRFLHHQICKQSAGIFLWVVLVTRMLNAEIDREGDLRSARALPETLSTDLDDIFAGHVQAAQALVAAGAKINRMDSMKTSSMNRFANKPLLRSILLYGFLDNDNYEGHTPLSWFSMRGNLEAVRTLLKLDVRLDTRNGRQKSALMEACANGHTEVVALLLEHGADVKPADPAEQQILPLAAKSGHQSVCELLLTRRSEQLAQGNQKEAALLICCERNDIRIGQLLLDGAVSLNGSGKEADLPLCILARKGSEGFIRRILKRKPDLNLPSPTTGRTAVAEACRSGHLRIVELLLDHGSQAGLRSLLDGKTALMEAAEHGHADIVSLLADHPDSDVNAFDRHDRTALWYAAGGNHSNVVRVLLQRNVTGSLEKRGRVDGRPFAYTPLCLACTDRASEAVVLYLLEAGANVHAVNTAGWTALAEAGGRGRFHITEMLLERGADPNSRNSLNKTPLHIAAEGNHASIVELLIDQGHADIDAQDWEGNSPLLLAIWNNNYSAARALVQRGADVNLRGKGYHGLNVAALRGYLNCVYLLLDTGKVNVDVQNEGRWTSLAEACHHGHLEIVQALVARGANEKIRNAGGQLPADLVPAGRQDIANILGTLSLVK